jgi:hypothetical protein
MQCESSSARPPHFNPRVEGPTQRQAKLPRRKKESQVQGGSKAAGHAIPVALCCSLPLLLKAATTPTTSLGGAASKGCRSRCRCWRRCVVHPAAIWAGSAMWLGRGECFYSRWGCLYEQYECILSHLVFVYNLCVKYGWTDGWQLVRGWAGL